MRNPADIMSVDHKNTKYGGFDMKRTTGKKRKGTVSGGKTNKSGGSRTPNNQLKLKIDNRGRCYCILEGQHEVEGRRPRFEVVAYKEKNSYGNPRTMISYRKFPDQPYPDPRDVLDGLKTMIRLLKESDRIEGTSFLRVYDIVEEFNCGEEFPYETEYPKDPNKAYLNVVKPSDCVGAELLFVEEGDEGSLFALVALNDGQLCSNSTNIFKDPEWPADVLRYILDDVEELLS